jgi:hypothetical protein
MISDKTRALLNPWQLSMLDRLSALDRVMELPREIGYGHLVVSLLAPLVVPACRTALLLVSPGEIDYYSIKYASLQASGAELPSLIPQREDAYVVPDAPTVHLCSHYLLSKPEGNTLLESIRPDLIVSSIGVDDTTRSRRLYNYLRNNEQARMLRWSDR